MRMTLEMQRLAMVGVLAVLVVSSSCFRPRPGDSPLYLETIEKLPPPDPNETLQATYDSPDGLARISIFPGTVVAGTPTVEKIDPSQAAGPLQSPDNEFALRLGPDGSQFNVPVRISLLVGEVARLDDGSYVIPNVEVVTEDAAKVEMLSDPQMEITENDLLIAHVLTSHFSDMVYKLKIGVDISIDSPADDAVFGVGETIATGLRVTNHNDMPLRAKATETNKAPIGPVTYNNGIVTIPAQSSNLVGVGTCSCTATGMGLLEYDLEGDYKDLGDIDPSLILFKKFVDVNCTKLETIITVTFNPETHTTNYSVSTFHTTESTNFQRQEVFRGPRLSYRWTSASTCGTFGNPGDFPANSYEHEGCSAAEEAAARIQVEVTYVADDGRVIKRTYNESSRANEGKGPIQF